jgi:hypothetical protein
METLNSKDLVDLWESWNDRGKLHVGYIVCVDMSILSIMGLRDWNSASLFHRRLFLFHTMNGHFIAQLQHCGISYQQ